MVSVPLSHVATWSIAAAAVVGVITRPRNWPEAWWAASGALALVLFSLISPTEALTAVGKGTDVYLFLTGMMILAECARREGLFDWLAAYALQHARGSGKRLFFLTYAVGTGVTIFVSNDATAVVLTPAVYAAARQASSLATILWLVAIRREGEDVSAGKFLAVGAFVMPLTLLATLVIFSCRL